MPSPADRLFKVEVRVNGKENPDVYKCIQSVRVEENIRQGSTFEIVVSLCRNDDGTWPIVDAKEFNLWDRIRISVTMGSVTDVVLDGYLSDVHLSTTPQTASLQANFAGVDASYVMDLQPHTKTWPSNLNYEQIAGQILDHYQFTKHIAENTAQPPSTPPPAVVQRDTDLRFLRNLARRRGYEFYVVGGDAYFGPPDVTSTPQKDIASNFGQKTNCTELHISVDGTRPTDAVVARQDLETGEPVAELKDGSDSGIPPMGADDPGTLRGYGIGPTRLLPRGTGPLPAAEIPNYIRAQLMRSAFWLKATGALNALRYGAILRAGKPVQILGFGKERTGVYYVRRVTHMITSRTYRMEFEAYRNRTGKTGAETFNLENPEDTASPPALGPGAGDLIDTRADGNRVLA
jgi:phage protein D